jgi:hypothetical protein
MLQQKTSNGRRPYAELFAISFLILFFELACIRWFGAYVVFLTFFSNIVLLASFLGMSVGCLAASRKRNFVNWVPWLALIAVLSAIVILLLYKVNPHFTVDVGDQTSPERVYFGTEYRHPDLAGIVVPIEAIAGYFFVLVALMFVGLGQVMGRRFDMIPNRVLAYTTNVAGSLVGIVSFALLSYFWLSPFWWFLPALGCVAYFLKVERRRWRIVNWVCLGLTVVIVVLAGRGDGMYRIGRALVPKIERQLKHKQFYWSPYYWISFNTQRLNITTNNIGHQQMKARGTAGVAYVLPYVLSQDGKRPPIKDVLIIGAGSGNDVSAALWAGAEHVDAVEIDPLIYELGERHHPDKPYEDDRVKVHLNDGRNFLKESDRKYDLIVYALVDSLILHSGYSSIRLENYLFTQQAMADVRARLKEGGVFVMYNFFRQGWIVARLTRMVREEFGREPIVMSLPYREEIKPWSLSDKEAGFTMIIAGDTDAIERAFQAKESYWIRKNDFLSKRHTMGFGVEPPEEGLVRIAPARVVESEESKLLPSDNWPFLYLKKSWIPALNLRGMAVIGALSLIILLLFVPKKTVRFNWTMFFLGAGFMLLETKSVVHLALLFGSTWVVNSVVFFAILVMILLSNLYVLLFRPRRLTFFYAALLISLVLNIFFQLDFFLGLPEAVKIAGSCLIVFIPIFFAGVIFAALFRDSANPDMDLGSNIAGVVLGGLAENFSMVLGFNHLLWVAIAFYLLSRVLSGRFPPGTAGKTT